MSEREKAERKLLHLATAIEGIAEGVLITALDGTIEYVNNAATGLTLHTTGELVGRNIRDFSGRKEETFFQSILDALVAEASWLGQARGRRKDGTSFEAAVTVSPVRDPSGHILSYLVIWRDISQQMRLERELRQAQKMEPLGLIAGGIAHDFNNVLTAIIGFSELALEDVPDDSRAKRFVRNIAKAGMRGKELVRHIMTLSGRHAEEYRPVEMASVVGETLGMLRASIPAPIEIMDDIRDEKSVVIADPTQLQQVLMNLSTNASHAMRERGGTIRITLTRSTFSSTRELPDPGLKPGDYMRLTVSDTGPGIPEPILQHIFDPFFTTKKQGEGTGLGLSVSLAIVKNHGGAITVASERGKGSKFDVYWPVWGAPAIEEPLQEGEIPRGHERLLFVDDDESIADMEKVALERLGYRVAVKTDSLEALETFRHDPGAFDLVITDQVMPHLSGRDLAKRLIAVRRDVPIILMTGFNETVTADEVKTPGIRDLLSKPVTKRELAESIRRVLDAVA